MATVEVGSIATGDAQRDGHLKSADFFETEKFPTMTFKSFKVLPEDGAVEGELTIKGVTKTVEFDVEGPTIPAKDPWGNLRVAVEATAKISRKDFGLTWISALESGGVLVGDEVTITLDAPVCRRHKKEAPATDSPGAVSDTGCFRSASQMTRGGGGIPVERGGAMSLRPVKEVIQTKPTLEGAGVKLERAFGFGKTKEFDPILLLDYFRNNTIPRII